ncbi:QRFP-like peptide receptor [Eumeta japonica]|uniref:QRFP-like peptide receptor n=1 Tax=Eumeta variegata TaxID=151549 RepID=A0A4C1UKM5_EUMVA|nr:QRFP-like peptide receptor [Eumeta japonica]
MSVVGLAVPFVELTVAHASVLTILAISFERYYAICEPLRAGYVCTKTRATLICALAWFFAALFTRGEEERNYFSFLPFYHDKTRTYRRMDTQNCFICAYKSENIVDVSPSSGRRGAAPAPAPAPVRRSETCVTVHLSRARPARPARAPAADSIKHRLTAAEERNEGPPPLNRVQGPEFPCVIPSSFCGDDRTASGAAIFHGSAVHLTCRSR